MSRRHGGEHVGGMEAARGAGAAGAGADAALVEQQKQAFRLTTIETQA